ncbi:hypothetical protein OIU78_004306 [Salix suchowensis]|nr:hypothetical protein OIU78_004306 [Salix suchowensis]
MARHSIRLRSSLFCRSLDTLVRIHLLKRSVWIKILPI